MFDQLEIMKVSHGLSRHAAARQAAVAQNIANVNTPGYQRVAVPSFAELHAARMPGDALRATRAGHLEFEASFAPPVPQVVRGGSAGLDGNTVSLEDEIVSAAELRQQHDMAVSVYQTALSILRTSLGRA
ncbi:MAG: FlgB family protein [Pseudomonadota bacterium]